MSSSSAPATDQRVVLPPGWTARGNLVYDRFVPGVGSMLVGQDDEGWYWAMTPSDQRRETERGGPEAHAVDAMNHAAHTGVAQALHAGPWASDGEPWRPVLAQPSPARPLVRFRRETGGLALEVTDQGSDQAGGRPWGWHVLRDGTVLVAGSSATVWKAAEHAEKLASLALRGSAWSA